MWLKKPEEFEDLMSAIYFNGLRDGILEALVILVALHSDTKTDERVSDEAANNENIDYNVCLKLIPGVR